VELSVRFCEEEKTTASYISRIASTQSHGCGAEVARLEHMLSQERLRLRMAAQGTDTGVPPTYTLGLIPPKGGRRLTTTLLMSILITKYLVLT
jgi:hypothetical protein